MTDGKKKKKEGDLFLSGVAGIAIAGILRCSDRQLVGVMFVSDPEAVPTRSDGFPRMEALAFQAGTTSDIVDLTYAIRDKLQSLPADRTDIYVRGATDRSPMILDDEDDEDEEDEFDEDTEVGGFRP